MADVQKFGDPMHTLVVVFEDQGISYVDLLKWQVRSARQATLEGRFQ